MDSAHPAPLTRCEMPPEGITLLGCVVRRMKRTALLLSVPDLIRADQAAEALAQIALYAAGAAAFFGPACYLPKLDAAGSLLRETDPATGAVVEATLESASAPRRISYRAQLPGGGLFTGREEITGVTARQHGLGLPASARFKYFLPAATYTAALLGVIVSEPAPRLLADWRIAARGTLDLRDSLGNQGALSLNRDGAAAAVVFHPDGSSVVRQTSFAPGS